MKTEHYFALKLKEMMMVESLEEISVLSLCKKCNVNRQTFYYHFHNIYDLLTLVFLDEKIPDILRVQNCKELLEILFKYYIKNSHFIDASINSIGKDLVLEFFYNNCYQAFMKITDRFDKDKNLNLNDKKPLVRFFASGYSFSVLYYLSNYKNKSLDGLLSNFSFVGDDELKSSINNLKRQRKKV